MYFQPEGELAFHTVSAATYGLLKDIKNTRGLKRSSRLLFDQHLLHRA